MEKVIKWICMAFVMMVPAVICLGLLFVLKDEWIARHPSVIARMAGFSLPAYTVVEKADNMDRVASAWSEYQWELQLKEPLSEKKKKKLDRLVKKDPEWTYQQNEHAYMYDHSGWDDFSYSISVTVAEQRVTLSYYWYDMLF